MHKTVTDSTKKRVLALQSYRCNNKPFYFYEKLFGCIPNSDINGDYIFDEYDNITYYECPLWKFDGSLTKADSYVFDYVIDRSDGGTNHISNIQVLCNECHAVKARAYTRMKSNRKLEHYYNYQPVMMDID